MSDIVSSPVGDITPSQTMWPFGPAPMRACGDGEHDWMLIDLFQACSPPAPSFECSRCHWRWSRRWTQAEAEKWIPDFLAFSRQYYGPLTYPAEPEYAEGE